MSQGRKPLRPCSSVAPVVVGRWFGRWLQVEQCRRSPGGISCSVVLGVTAWWNQLPCCLGVTVTRCSQLPCCLAVTAVQCTSVACLQIMVGAPLPMSDAVQTVFRCIAISSMSYMWCSLCLCFALRVHSWLEYAYKYGKYSAVYTCCLV